MDQNGKDFDFSRGFEWMTDSQLKFLANEFPNVKNLNLSITRVVNNQSHISDEGTKYPQLENFLKIHIFLC